MRVGPILPEDVVPQALNFAFFTRTLGRASTGNHIHDHCRDASIARLFVAFVSQLLLTVIVASELESSTPRSFCVIFWPRARSVHPPPAQLPKLST